MKRKASHQLARKPAEDTIRDQVFGTFDLLECILSHLDMQTLLLAQRVCQEWHHVILRSPYLQQQLFFQPRHIKPDDSDAELERNKNPLLQRHFHQLFEDTESLPHTKSYFRLRPSVLASPGMSIRDMREDRKRHMAFTRSGASWRNMLITQPAITSIIYIMDSNDHRDWRWPQIVEFPEGLRMGQFYDLIFSAIWTRAKDSYRGASIKWAPPGGEWLGRKGLSNPIELGLVIRETYYSQAGNSDCVGHHQGHCRCRDVRTQFFRERTAKSTRWMFQCEEYTAQKSALQRLRSVDLGNWQQLQRNVLFG
ncbi:F-box-like domain-containing [Fusarium albosuccineum]|uniref:F-box-like domain-containing n=1 Tax=Fusarium albosuccineum TaxID=1237068 RepID=A0A8H4LK94_9HYPO|nr:F-box-like domain-containing [Fusarium albosuccineum]